VAAKKIKIDQYGPVWRWTIVGCLFFFDSRRYE